MKHEYHIPIAILTTLAVAACRTTHTTQSEATETEEHHLTALTLDTMLHASTFSFDTLDIWFSPPPVVDTTQILPTATRMRITHGHVETTSMSTSTSALTSTAHASRTEVCNETTSPTTPLWNIPLNHLVVLLLLIFTILYIIRIRSPS